jgi:hypothetical protein
MIRAPFAFFVLPPDSFYEYGSDCFNLEPADLLVTSN